MPTDLKPCPFCGGEWIPGYCCDTSTEIRKAFIDFDIALGIPRTAQEVEARTILVNSILDAVSSLNRRASQWVSVEKPPEKGSEVLVWNGNSMRVADWPAAGSTWFPDHPTHWMPLPDPPEDDDA